MSNPRTFQRIPVVRSLASSSSAEPNVSLTPWRQHPPRGFAVLDDHSLACRHNQRGCCPVCADAHREIVAIGGRHYWMASEADFAELLAGVDSDRGQPDGAGLCDHKEWGPACPFCLRPAMAIAAGKPGRKYLVIRYDVTDLTEDQIDTLAGCAIVQGEASDLDETPCGSCEDCQEGDPNACTCHPTNYPDVEAEQVEVIAC